MRVHKQLDLLPSFTNAVITIGTFDGVHIGHMKIIQQLKEEANKINGETVIITFHPHPRKVVSSVPGDIKLLNTLAERIELLEKTGIDHLVVIPFDYRFSNQRGEQFAREFLWHYFKPHTIIIGYDHHFGKGRSGNYELLKQLESELHFIVKEIPEQILKDATISSTKIREALFVHDIATANACLGYKYFFGGLVIEGNKLGRTIGYPTANIHIENEEKLIPGNGVYVVKIKIDDERFVGKEFGGMMNIGLRPTVDGKKRMIEVNIFDFNDDIYNHTVRVELLHYLRGEVKFNGLDELKNQLAKDKTNAMQLL